MQSNVVQFPPSRRGRTFAPEFVLFEGHRRRQWTVAERAADGAVIYHTVFRGRHSEAVAMSRHMAQAEARQARWMETLAADPLGRAYLALSPETRAAMIQIFASIDRAEIRA